MTNIILTPAEYRLRQSEVQGRTLPKKASGNLTLPQFFDLMYYTLQIVYPELIYTPAWPDYLYEQSMEKSTQAQPAQTFINTITYLVSREEPGCPGGEPFSGRTQERTPRLREMVNMPGDVKSKMIYGQWFDSLVQFDLWAKTSFEVENMTLQFKRFMTQYRDFFKKWGIGELLYWWRGRDDTAASINPRLQLRTLVYFVRTEELSFDEGYNLKNLDVQIQSLIRS